MIRYIGAPIRRNEDPRLLRGRGQYVDDLRLAGALTAAFVRSPYAHAAVVSVDTHARDGAFAAGDLPDLRPITTRMEREGFLPTPQWPLARDRVRYVGEPVAVVCAEDRYAAEDLAETVTVRYDPLGIAAGIDAALHAHAPRLHPPSENVLYHEAHVAGDPETAFRDAEVTVRATIATPRATAVPLEGRGMIASLEGDVLTVWTNTQIPSLVRSGLAACLGLPEHRIRVVVPDTGGGFGQKMHLYPEDVAVSALALRTGRPVKWIEDRRENLTAATQAREERVTAELAARRDGTVLGLRARIFGDVGAYHAFPTTAALEPLGVAQILPGPYAVPHYAYEVSSVCTNKAPTGAYRGVGMTVGVFVMERLMDLLARTLGLDPVDVRLRNLITGDAFPYQAAGGLVYDSGSFREALERVCAVAGYARLREEQRASRAAGRRIGIGVSCYTEYTGMGSATFARRGMRDVPGHEAATIRVDPSGIVHVALSFPSQGQGHETTMAQIVAEILQLPLERVRVERVDTALGPDGTGTFASRASVAGGGATFAAARAVRARAFTVAATLLEAAPADIELASGRFRVRGAPQRSVSFEEVASAASRVLPEKAGAVGPGLDATESFDPPAATFSNAAHLTVVDVDDEVGMLRVLRYVVAEDCGRVLNPLIVDGQIHGALAQGIGGALLEHARYDEQGQPLAATLLDYLIPTAEDMPPVEITHLDHPAQDRPGGMKGMGEGGTIGSPAALANAISDALGAEVFDLPVSPERVRTLLNKGRASG